MKTVFWKSLAIVLVGILVLGGIGLKVCIYNYIQEYIKSQYDKSIHIWKETNKIIPKGGVVFVGDSITQGFNINEFFNEKALINRGIIGDTTEGVLLRMNESVYELNPSKVIILIGTNDLGEYKKEPKYIAGNIEKIVWGIKANIPHTKIYVQSVYPVNKSNHPIIKKTEVAKRTNIKIEEINAFTKELCKNNGIVYIDVYSKLLDANNNLDIKYTIDGLHLNANGYKKVVAELSPYIKE